MAMQSGKKDALQCIDQLAPFCIEQLREVALFPYDGGQMPGLRQREKLPIRFELPPVFLDSDLSNRRQS
jgi:hypothetical protein